MQPFSRHAGFFASLKQVEDRLAAEQQREPPPLPRQPDPPMLFSDTMTASPLFLATSTATAMAADHGGESTGLALDLLTLTKDEDGAREGASDDDDGYGGEDIARLMALLGLSTLRGVDDDDSGCGGGCDCSGGEGFLAKVVGMVGPKCDQEKKRVDGWIEHYRGSSGGCRGEPARLAHLLLAKASWCWDGEGHGRGDEAAIAFPSTVKKFLDRDAPPRSTEEGKAERLDDSKPA